ncbi:FAD-dependent monooxygenase [Streptomyces sp. NPDC096198]|uniref:FAD-dependent monooxygenase n=1 Tax=Streptomyces sp. NPDC096198 TaxID=3366080 RepID=UPI0038232E98
MSDEIIVVGAGPTGLMLAAELRLAGVAVTVLERAAGRGSYSKALALHTRTLEIFAMRGICERFASKGARLPVSNYGGLSTPLNLSVLDSRFPFTLITSQVRTEHLLEEWLRELGGEIRWQHQVRAVHQDADTVTVEVETPSGVHTMQADWVVGCDGAGSTVRTSVGIEFPGTSSTVSGFLGDVLLETPPTAPAQPYRNEHGGINIFTLEDGYHRIVGTTRDLSTIPASQELTFQELRSATIAVAGTDFGMRDARWLSRYGNAARQAARYREGRVLLAGDAAHMHMPFGGQGLNVGLQDAFNLGWKLASVCHHRAPAELLDTYHKERHPIGAALLENTQAQTALGAIHTPDMRMLRTVVDRVLARHPEVNRELASQVAALEVCYPSAEGGPLIGMRAPDIGLEGASAPSLYPLLADGRFVLLHLVTADAAMIDPDAIALSGKLAGGAERVRTVVACPTTAHQDWDNLGTVLVRPDGHIAWARTTASAPDRIPAEYGRATAESDLVGASSE